MIQTVPIRKATSEDLPNIRGLEGSVDTAAHWTEQEYAALFDPGAPHRIVLIAIDEAGTGKIQGFCVACCGTDDWEIENVVVAHNRRRRGLGTALVRAVLDEAVFRAAPAVLLEVRQSNQPARLLYEKLGFKEVGRRRGYYQIPTEDAVVLRISIAVT